MSRQRPAFGATLLTAALALWLAGCASDDPPTAPGDGSGLEAAVAPATTFGPFPAGTSIFVDVDNRTGVENGTRAHPFKKLSKAIRQARNGSVIGLAPGVYAEKFTPLTENYVIEGLRNFKLLGMGPSRTTIRGDHSFSLIQIRGGSGLIQGLTIEQGGDAGHSVGGGLQVLGYVGPVTLTVREVVLQDNQAVNGAGVDIEGDASVKLVNVVVANNHASNGPGAIAIEGANHTVSATIKNSTITGNTAIFFGGVEAENGARLDMVNSIVWNNSSDDLKIISGAIANVSFSDIDEQLVPGTGNVSTDPKFVDSTAHNYRLRKSSTLVDAGTNTDAPLTDVLGHTRPLDGDGDGAKVTDMGAYER
jgi:hypothetical protein